MGLITNGLKTIRKRLFPSLQEGIHVISFPKCGRTWLKIMLAEYFSRKYGKSKTSAHINFLHDDTPFWKKARELEVSKRLFRKSKVVFLIRDPRDMIVSGFFQKSKRHLRKPEEERRKQNKPVYTKSLREYVYEEVGGIDTIIKYFNIWWDQKNEPEDFLLLKYEDLNRDTFQTMLSLFSFLNEEDVDEPLLKEVITFCAFDNLKKLEKENKYESQEFGPQNPEDPDSYKVRRGKVGGYVDYLNVQEIDYINQKIIADLNSTLGYSDI